MKVLRIKIKIFCTKRIRRSAVVRFMNQVMARIQRIKIKMPVQDDKDQNHRYQDDQDQKDGDQNA